MQDILTDILWFSVQCENERWSKLANIAKLIVYPITRLIGMPIAVYISYYQYSIMPISLYWFMMFSGSFLVLISFIHSIQIWINPIKTCSFNISDVDESLKYENGKHNEEKQALLEI